MVDLPLRNNVAIASRRMAVSVFETFVLFAVLVGCEDSPRMSPALGERLATACPSATSPHYYVRLEKGGYLQKWISQHLQQAEADPLWCGAPRPTAFRLLYLPSHRPAVIVSISKSARNWLGQSSWTAKTVRFEDPRSTRAIDSAAPARVTERSELALSVKEAADFLGAIGSTSFWNAAPWKEQGVDDGTIILIEGQQDGVYRAVGRWSTDASMFELASVFARTAKLPVTAEIEDAVYRFRREEGQP